MAYLLDPHEVAVTIGAKCAGNIASDNDAMLMILNKLLPRIEDVMNVSSLTHGETTDTFDVEVAPAKLGRVGASLRLMSGYVDATTVTITDPRGEAVSLYTIDTRYGIVYLDPMATIEGRYIVKYEAGFAAAALEENPEVEVFTNLPEWIKGLVTTLMVAWYRTCVIAPKIPEGYRYGELTEALRHEITVRVMERYQRPRAGMKFPLHSVRTDGLLT